MRRALHDDDDREDLIDCALHLVRDLIPEVDGAALQRIEMRACQAFGGQRRYVPKSRMDDDGLAPSGRT